MGDVLGLVVANSESCADAFDTVRNLGATTGALTPANLVLDEFGWTLAAVMTISD